MIPNMRTKIDKNKFVLFKKSIPLFLLPEKYQIMLFSKWPPSKDPIGIKFKNPRNKFNIATLKIILMIISSLFPLKKVTKRKTNAVKKHNRGLTNEIFILPKAVLQSFSVCKIAPRK